MGLNPLGEPKAQDVEALENQFGPAVRDNERPGKNRTLKDTRYFRRFRGVSQRLYDLLGRESGVAHTDLVKCSSKRFLFGRAAEGMIANCLPFLEAQLTRYHPRLVLCNGADVVAAVGRIVGRGPTSDETSYTVTHDGHEITLVCSGFIQRLDRHAQRRLGREVEAYMDQFGIV
ncbi:MAG: hypothetical protein Q8P50_14600 [Bacillota bacterium]|nr:hypothetical protein [Bacillota bacterium]